MPWRQEQRCIQPFFSSDISFLCRDLIGITSIKGSAQLMLRSSCCSKLAPPLCNAAQNCGKLLGMATQDSPRHLWLMLLVSGSMHRCSLTNIRADTTKYKPSTDNDDTTSYLIIVPSSDSAYAATCCRIRRRMDCLVLLMMRRLSNFSEIIFVKRKSIQRR